MNLRQWIQHKKNQTEWRKWLNDPVTVSMIAGLKNSVHVTTLDVPSGEGALQALGFVAGKHAAVFVLENLDSYIDEPMVDDSEKQQVDYLVRVEGYSALDAKNMVKEGQV